MVYPKAKEAKPQSPNTAQEKEKYMEHPKGTPKHRPVYQEKELEENDLQQRERVEVNVRRNLAK